MTSYDLGGINRGHGWQLSDSVCLGCLLQDVWKRSVWLSFKIGAFQFTPIDFWWRCKIELTLGHRYQSLNFQNTYFTHTVTPNGSLEVSKRLFSQCNYGEHWNCLRVYGFIVWLWVIRFIVGLWVIGLLLGYGLLCLWISSVMGLWRKVT